MAKKRLKTLYAEMNVKENNFVSKLLGGKKSHNFSDIQLLRNLLSNEKARILYALKQDDTTSIYSLSKQLGRDFKSVYSDLKLLERFGFIDFVREKSGKRIRMKPILLVDELTIHLSI